VWQAVPTKKAAELHAADQNLIEENEAKAKAAKADEGTEQAPEDNTASTEPEVQESKPQAASVSESAKTEKTVAPPADPTPGDKPEPRHLSQQNQKLLARPTCRWT
jgi:hypothetical protein